ncbi:hypothetical protein [Salinibius halmophilus]|uniref:hypothetical protein n=1 Tax=Salinibius halmophilus TaxID=1853216 RepID=UPI000E668735|nr:hypothetical protein [Salinibius halmophilus]
MTDEIIERDFYARPEEEQAQFLEYTWCGECMEVDLGMHEPKEYELNGVVIIEGLCNKCNSPIITELSDDDEDF